jgi:hypothetical protein
VGLEPDKRLLQIHELLGLVNSQPAELLTPAVLRLVRDPQLLCRLRRGQPLVNHYLHRTQVPDNLHRFVCLASKIACCYNVRILPRQLLCNWTNLWGAGNPPLILELERKFSMNELWEAAFHQLARLEPRKAYVIVKGAMEHPESIRTIDNPMGKVVKFPHTESYVKLDELESAMKQRMKDCSAKLTEYVEMRRIEKKGHQLAQEDESIKAPESLAFLEE